MLSVACAVSESSPQGTSTVEPEWRRSYSHRGGAAAGRSRGLAPAETAAVAACGDVEPFRLYRFVEGIDSCLQPMSAAEIAALGDPFATEILAQGSGDAAKWPSSVESAVGLVAAIPNFAANQKSYMIGEGSQITTAIAPRDANRNLRYVVSWGASASPTVFLSAAPTGTHPGRPAPFLQVIGYDQRRNLFNFYEYMSNPGQPTRTWAFAGDSSNARDSRTAGLGCMRCHINGALNMKELVPPWNNWGSSMASISSGNIPAGVVGDPLYIHLSNADLLQSNFESVQTRYSQGLVAQSISGGRVSGVPVLLRRLITTSTVSFAASAATDATTIQVPNELFLQFRTLGTSQINLSFAAPSSFAMPTAMHDAFLAANGFALQQLDRRGDLAYRRPGSTFSPLFVPVSAYEDRAMAQQLINQKVIDASFAAAVLLVDFPNPVFSQQRESMMTYADQIESATLLGTGADSSAVPARFIALVEAAANSQPPCDTSRLLGCTAEQQFLFYAGQSDWRTRAKSQVEPYLAAVAQRLGTTAGVNDYMVLSASRQAQFAGSPRVGSLNEFALLLPCNTLALDTCKRMNPDGTLSDDRSSSCVAQTCVPSS